MRARQGATMIAPTGVAAMVRHHGHVRGGVAIMSVHIGSGASTTVAAGNKDTETIKKPPATVSPGRFYGGFARHSGTSEWFEPHIAPSTKRSRGRFSLVSAIAQRVQAIENAWPARDLNTGKSR
jgi:hypothetical protein